MTTTSVEKILTIEVHAGWAVGTKIVFANEGDQGPNKIPADLVFIIRCAKHERFDRHADDLHWCQNCIEPKFL